MGATLIQSASMAVSVVCKSLDTWGNLTMLG